MFPINRMRAHKPLRRLVPIFFLTEHESAAAAAAMWRSKARALLLRSLNSHPQIRPSARHQVPLKTLIQPSRPLPSRLIPNPRFFSSAPHAANPSFPSASDSNETVGSDETSAWDFEEPADDSPLKFDENVDSSQAVDWNLGEPDAETEKDDTFAEVPDEPGEGDGAEVVEVAEITAEQVESVVSILKGDAEEDIELSLDKLEQNISEEFVVKVIEASDGVGENLIRFFKWAVENQETVKSSRAIELLIRSVKRVPEFSKKEAYMLWDLVKELGTEKGVLNTEILNALISTFWDLGKARAGLEVFDKFDEFGCTPDGDSYYYTIQALGKRSLFDSAWTVCEKMINSGNLPDKEKIGEVICFFCKGKKVKEAHLVYLMAKEKNLSPQRSSLDFLICGLVRFDETVPLALELLGDYPRGSYKHANKTFGLVVKGLCRIKKTQEAKELLQSMVESGPPPGSASFNYVINALSKGGELDDAVALLKVMEGRGLRPDVYTYTVVMSGYAKGGLMDEAYKIFCEAKKKHAKLCPATYHILTRGYCKMEEFEKALECMKEMKEHGVKPTEDEYNKMIQSLCLKALDWHAAEKLLEEMKESGLYVKGATRSLVAAVKELEGEETQKEVVSIEA